MESYVLLSVTLNKYGFTDQFVFLLAVSGPTPPLSPVMGSQVQCMAETPRNGEMVVRTPVLISHQSRVNLDR